MDDETDIRRRRAAWRACHRGTKELDILVGRYAAARLEAMTDAELTHFEDFLNVQDPDLQVWLLGNGQDAAAAAPGDAKAPFQALVADLRRFHGLT